jgi:hypothetical protein
MLQRADDCVARSLENSDDATFGAMSIFGAAGWDIATDPRNDTIAVHCSPGIFCRYENICLSRFFRNQKAVARLMDRQLPGHEIDFGRKDVTILANANDLARIFQFAQNFSDRNAVPALQAERTRDLVSIARPVIRRPQERQHLFSNCATVFGHINETIMEIVDLIDELQL